MADKKTYVTRCTVHFTKQPGKPGDKSKGIAPTPPQTKEIAPNTRINLNPEADQTLELLDMQAIMLAKDVPVQEEEDVDDADGSGGEKSESELSEEANRERYKELFGKDPAKNMKPETLVAKIDAEEKRLAVEDNDLV